MLNAILKLDQLQWLPNRSYFTQSETLFHPFWGLAYNLIVETIFPEPVVISELLTPNIPRHFLDSHFPLQHDNFNFHITNFPFLNSNNNLLPPMTFLCNSSQDLPRLASLRDVYKLLWQWYVRERLKSYLKMSIWGSYQAIRGPHRILELYHMQWHRPLIRHYTSSCLVTELDFITNSDIFTKSAEVSIEHSQRLRLANRWHLLLQNLDTPSCPRFAS